MSFSFQRLSIPDVILVIPKVFSDDRGFFIETYKFSNFADFGIKTQFVQDNHSFSAVSGIVRGLHFQKKPKAQAKLVKVMAGRIFDVAVDIRRNSPTYGKWVSAILSAENKSMLYIPEGFAHGFCVIEENTEVIYKCSQEYCPEYDRGVIWNDETIGIEWPVQKAVLSERDTKWPCLEKTDSNF